MLLCLHTYLSLTGVQEEFAKNFPGLKLSFIFHGDEKLNLSSHFNHSFDATTVNEICPDALINDIVINETMTSKEVEDMFEKSCHLPAKVYAKVDEYWQKNSKIDTTTLNKLILKNYN